ncbi:amidase [Lentzea sp. JNUCC 0626]|uniref:amidase n=1 Tax=Lentzea sp. JNUCC 0626 TaxID=3367513 RepID=UPI0037478D23
MAELHDLTALEQAAAVRTGEVGVVELVDHYLHRIREHDPALGAFVTVTADLARGQAAAAEALLRHGGQFPPLFGVPTAIKDLNNVAGVPMSSGSRAVAGVVPEHDDHVVTLLRDAGTISLGKTNVPEFGVPFYTESGVAPPARTPWDLTCSAGGSSGGAAAAVAAGLVPIAQGNDGGGSIRVPASVCGVVGLKASRGRIANGPGGGETTGMVANGPIARTVADAAAMLDAMAVPMPGELFTAAPLPLEETYLGHAHRPPGKLRIGRYNTPAGPALPVHEECMAAWDDATALLTELGHEVEDVESPFPAEIVHHFETVLCVGPAALALDDRQTAELTPLTRWLRERGTEVSAVEFVTSLRALRKLARTAVVHAAGYDALLTPTLAQPPRPVGWFTSADDPAANLRRQLEFSPFTFPHNVSGQPAITLPLRWTAQGLPIGVMLASRPAAEHVLIALAAQLESARPWRDRRPSIWTSSPLHTHGGSQ